MLSTYENLQNAWRNKLAKNKNWLRYTVTKFFRFVLFKNTLDLGKTFTDKTNLAL